MDSFDYIEFGRRVPDSIMITADGNEMGDLDVSVSTYAAKYKGRNKLLRLVRIAEHCSGHVQLQALRIAYDLIRNGEEDIRDMGLFLRVSNLIAGRLGTDYLLDEYFVTHNNTRFDDMCRQYKRELDHATEETDKDRLTFTLDELHYTYGRFSHIFHSFRRTHRLIEACMRTALVAIETREISHLRRERTLLEATYYLQDAKYKFRVDANTALADLQEKHYLNAAHGFLKLLETDVVINYDYSELLSLEDILLYGLICAMATFQTDNLETAYGGISVDVVDHLTPRGPAHKVTELVTSFLDGRFSMCLRLLESLRTRGFLDLYLAPHVDALVAEIRDIILAGYMSKFSVLLIETPTKGKMKMGDRFIYDSEGLIILETDARRLIQTNKLQGRVELDETAQLCYVAVGTEL